VVVDDHRLPKSAHEAGLEFDFVKPCEGCFKSILVLTGNVATATPSQGLFQEVEMLNVINLVLGSALLLAGRKLFWLFVGAAGFVTGIQLATRFSQGPDWLAIVIGLVIGVIFALLAIFLQAVVIWIAGFLTGGYVLSALAAIIGIQVSGTTTWIVYIIGGILGVILVSLLFDWALITLSSLAGASLVIQSFSPGGATGGILFIILFIAGVLIQGSLLRRERAVAATS